MPKWAENGNQIVTPPDAKIEEGFIRGQGVSVGHLNWALSQAWENFYDPHPDVFFVVAGDLTEPHPTGTPLMPAIRFGYDSIQQQDFFAIGTVASGTADNPGTFTDNLEWRPEEEQWRFGDQVRAPSFLTRGTPTDGFRYGYQPNAVTPFIKHLNMTVNGGMWQGETDRTPTSASDVLPYYMFSTLIERRGIRFGALCMPAARSSNLLSPDSFIFRAPLPTVHHGDDITNTSPQVFRLVSVELEYARLLQSVQECYVRIVERTRDFNNTLTATGNFTTLAQSAELRQPPVPPTPRPATKLINTTNAFTVLMDATTGSTPVPSGTYLTTDTAEYYIEIELFINQNIGDGTSISYVSNSDVSTGSGNSITEIFADFRGLRVNLEKLAVE